MGVAALALAGTATADPFGGIAANEKSYLNGPTRVCTPLTVADGKARGAPPCRTAATDEVAGLSARMPSADRGPKAEVVARAKNRTITVETKAGAAIVVWDAPDPITRIVDVWRSPTERLIVVEYVVRRGAREVHDVVGFDRGHAGRAPVDPPPADPPPADPGVDVGLTPGPESDVMKQAVAKARKTSGKKAVAAWTAILGLDPDHAEARYRLAVLDAGAKKPDAAVARLEQLAASKRADAVEWLVEARGDKAFARLVGDARFRAAVGLDRAPTTAYERIMGLGGRWEQSLIPCDRPELKLTFARDRAFSLVLRTSCQGSRDKVSYRGTWALNGNLVELRLPKLDTGDDVAPCSLAVDGDEDVLRCLIDADLTFEARPVRR